jgi:hypothetical protein
VYKHLKRPLILIMEGRRPERLSRGDLVLLLAFLLLPLVPSLSGVQSKGPSLEVAARPLGVGGAGNASGRVGSGGKTASGRGRPAGRESPAAFRIFMSPAAVGSAST